MAETKERLRELLHRCVTGHIHRAHQAYALCQVIGDHSWTINREGFGGLFRTLQISLADEMVLSITKLLESTDGRYPRRSIPAVLDYIDKQAADLEVVDRGRLEAAIAAGPDFDSTAGFPQADESLTRAAVVALRATLPKPKTFWVRRDKQIAHSEDTDLPDELRARVLGIYGMTWSLLPLGAMQAGAIAQFTSASFAVALGGAAVILFAVGMAVTNRQVRNLGTPVAANP